MENKQHPIELEANIQLIEETEELKKAVASIVSFPDNKTPDLSYFTGIFVSSGENLNKAYFMPSELVKAHDTIANKPLDIEHSESEIVGHIYDAAFIDRAGNKVEVSDLKNKTTAELEKIELDVMIAGILYKSRFPELAKEVKDNKWKLSMETYFTDFDVKVGNVIMTQQEAEALGLASEDVLGKIAKILRRGTEIAKGAVTRVLRNLLFSGCGLVKNPANPRSVILEVAAKRSQKHDDAEIVIELEPVNGDNTMAKDKEKAAGPDFTSPADVSGGPGAYETRQQTSIGICVSYKRRVVDATFEGPDAPVLHEDWCALYEQSCTSPSRGADNPECLRVKAKQIAKSYTTSKLEQLYAQDRRGDLVIQLRNLLDR